LKCTTLQKSVKYPKIFLCVYLQKENINQKFFLAKIVSAILAVVAQYVIFCLADAAEYVIVPHAPAYL